VDKTTTVGFSLKKGSNKSLQLAESSTRFSKRLIYLGILIVNSIKETIKLAIQNLKKKTRIAYASLVSSVTKQFWQKYLKSRKLGMAGLKANFLWRTNKVFIRCYRYVKTASQFVCIRNLAVKF